MPFKLTNTFYDNEPPPEWSRPDPLHSDVADFIATFDGWPETEAEQCALIEHRFGIGYLRAARLLDAIKPKGTHGVLEVGEDKPVCDQDHAHDMDCVIERLERIVMWLEQIYYELKVRHVN